MIDPNGEFVKTSFGQKYATHEYQINHMIDNLRNEIPSVPLVNEQFDTVLNKIEYQNGSSKVAVFIGNGYMNNETLTLPERLEASNIYTCFINPNIQRGSLAYEIAQVTKAMIVYDYTDFTDEICKFIYGEIPDVPNTNFMILTSTNLKKIILKGDLVYTVDCRDNKHINKPVSGYSYYLNNLETIVSYQGTCAHEFGHTFGIKDMYGTANANHGYEPIAQTEIDYDKNMGYGQPKAGCLMYYCGKLLATT